MGADRVSLRLRAALAAAAAVAVVLLLAAILVVQSTVRSDRSALDRRLERRATAVVAGGTALNLFDADRLRLPRMDQSVATALLAATDTAVRLYRDGRFVAAAGTLPPAPLPPAPGPGRRTLTAEPGGDWRSVTKAVPGRPWSVEVVTSLAPEADRRAALVSTMTLLTVVAAIAAALLAGGLVALGLRPLGRLRRTADEIAATGDLAPRVPVGGARETRSVATALNAMLDQIEHAANEREDALEATRRFVADAGHELRTPLATLDATLDLLLHHPELDPAERQDALTEALAEERRLSALTAALQSLARGDAGIAGDDGEVDLEALVSAAIASCAARHPGASLRRRRGPTVPPLRHASPTGLRVLVDNLLENAARHAGIERCPTIEVELSRGDAGYRLVVDDDGPGIAADQRDVVFERFRRAGGAAPGGSGLGLALVAQQASLHGGAARVGTSPLGGARVDVLLRERTTPPSADAGVGRGD